MIKQRIAVVTSALSDEKSKTDDLNTEIFKVKDWDYFVFSNKDLKATEPYQVVKVDITNFKSSLHATKHVKWQTHKYLPDYDIIIWLDAFMKFDEKNVNEIKNQIKKVSPACPILMRTQSFKSVDEDILWCLTNKRINDKTANSIRKYLEDNKFPATKQCQTFWSSAVIRLNKDAKLKECFENLFDLVNTVGFRDQHWLPFLLNKHKIKCSLMPTHLFDGSRSSKTYDEKSHHYADKF